LKKEGGKAAAEGDRYTTCPSGSKNRARSTFDSRKKKKKENSARTREESHEKEKDPVEIGRKIGDAFQKGKPRIKNKKGGCRQNSRAQKEGKKECVGKEGRGRRR